MRIHALTTAAVRVKHSFLFPSPGRRRQLALFTPAPFSDPLPIHCWAIEHEGVLRLVDAGETAAARDVPFARMEVTVDQELPGAMAAAGLLLDDVSEVVLTHAHGDHMDGLIHVRRRVLVNETELRFVRSRAARVMRRVLRQPLPPGARPRLTHSPARYARSRREFDHQRRGGRRAGAARATRAARIWLPGSSAGTGRRKAAALSRSSCSRPKRPPSE
jgi:glyoxylase-like metal-dependent hydrolase (beta-lactamase superfamily II)